MVIIVTSPCVIVVFSVLSLLSSASFAQQELCSRKTHQETVLSSERRNANINLYFNRCYFGQNAQSVILKDRGTVIKLNRNYTLQLNVITRLVSIMHEDRLENRSQ